MNRLGLYLLMSLLLVFGTMVEFSAVLIIKQKLDWDKKAMDRKEQKTMIRSSSVQENTHSVSKIMTNEDLEEKRKTADIEIIDQHIPSNPILRHLTFSKDIPSYRKIDIISFVLFSCFYFCFNFIYFIYCIHY